MYNTPKLEFQFSSWSKHSMIYYPNFFEVENQLTIPISKCRTSPHHQMTDKNFHGMKNRSQSSYLQRIRFLATFMHSVSQYTATELFHISLTLNHGFADVKTGGREH